MPLFRRHNSVPPTAAIAAFWQWWPTARPRIEAAIAGGGWDGLPDEVTQRIKAISPDLEWEFGAGRQSAHALVVSAAGSRELRVLAERWYRAAPPPDRTWEFHPARQPDPQAFTRMIQFGPHQLGLGELRFGHVPDDDRRQLDVVVYHPGFATVPERDRTQVSFLALDWLLGEDVVGAWIGVIDATTDPGIAPDTGDGLRTAVATLADEPPLWTVLTGTSPGGRPVMATVQTPLRPIRWPLFDQHIAVVLPYPPADERGLPDGHMLEELRTFEDRLVGRLDHTAALIAHETSDGRRVLHLYADAATPATGLAEAMRTEWPGGARVTVDHDPNWEGVAHLRL